ncbi:MAG: hypothetical protein HQM14_11880 [SAR324 cluster bacterium]|nr:hypothetical protein [SAR324 cluster bacterium]
MNKQKETFHLMAVPKHFTSQVIQEGGRFLQMKNKQLQKKILKLIQQNGELDQAIHILDPHQQRTYEVLGEEYIEDMSICKTVFEQNREGGYRVFKGGSGVVTCKECKKILKQKNAS